MLDEEVLTKYHSRTLKVAAKLSVCFSRDTGEALTYIEDLLLNSRFKP